MSIDYRAGQPGVFKIARVRNLRQNSTEAERKLWSVLRDRQTGVQFRRQHRFGPYILDFCCAEKRLAIEADGSQHLEAEGLARDEMRDAYLTANGIRVLRFLDNEILANLDGVTAAIMCAIDGQPSP